jgi:hypothetical protein
VKSTGAASRAERGGAAGAGARCACAAVANSKLQAAVVTHDDFIAAAP